MKAGILTETHPGETRVAAVPETVGKLTSLGLETIVQAGAGAGAHVRDDDYRKAGAEVTSDAADVIEQAGLLLKVRPPSEDQAGRLGAEKVLVGLLDPAGDPDRIVRLAETGVTAFAMERIPRITRAQSMDALSSMSTLAGYKAVIVAADRLGRIAPMLMTAAGTLKPARALVIGAGVAGLQAIATARRLGAIVKGVDTRPAAGEQVESLGARFVPLEVTHEAETAGGYAADLGEDFYRQEQELLAEHVAEADVIICTALIPGRPAPVLITEAMVETMKPGSVIVDLAAVAGGNCALTRADEEASANGVTVLGPTNLPATLPVHASQMYARNVAAFLGEFIREGRVEIDLSNEVVSATLVAHKGRPVEEPSPAASDEGPAGGAGEDSPTGRPPEDNTRSQQ
jgi:NAD(P) transhydrogenase subunit alpha